MKIAVILKFFRGELNPFDAAALECALELGEEVIALSMAPPSAEQVLKGITRLGVRTILISDPAYAGGDTLATSYVLAKALQRLSPDVVFAGRQSMDGDTAQVPPMLARRLSMDFIPGVIELDGKVIKTRNGAETILKSGTVLTFERIRTLRFPSIFSRVETVEQWGQSTLMLDEEKCGLKGSPTRVLHSYESNVGRRSCAFVETSEFDTLIKAVSRRADTSKVLPANAKVEKLYYVGNIGRIAEEYANLAIPLDVRGKSAEAVAEELQAMDAEIVLFESCEEYRILAARCAVIVEAGLCADCISFGKVDGMFVMTRPALGGNVTADIISRSKFSFATVRPAQEDGEEIIFSVGKGALLYLEEIRMLAEKYGANLACTRSVVDMGGMPYSCQVGQTGKTVSPKIYVAFGISGAVQHTAAISGAGTVIAINTDKNARIFDYSDFGMVADVRELLRGR